MKNLYILIIVFFISCGKPTKRCENEIELPDFAIMVDNSGKESNIFIHPVISDSTAVLVGNFAWANIVTDSTEYARMYFKRANLNTGLSRYLNSMYSKLDFKTKSFIFISNNVKYDGVKIKISIDTIRTDSIELALTLKDPKLCLSATSLFPICFSIPKATKKPLTTRFKKI